MASVTRPSCNLIKSAGKSITIAGCTQVFVAILDSKTDDFGRKVFVPQIEGSATALQLPGIMDEVVIKAPGIWLRARHGLTRVANVRFPSVPQPGVPGCCPSASPFRRDCWPSGVQSNV